ncbi:hypothetical protein C1645_774667 [Glomus cerebriforme]|uniref:Uncharacterized protein n=1 Tax=Glomus cerebriforme TaxID=658196 RepID=A0A397SUE6_9GLOM|nr:hypothetical protein C1645_774667 [Glomus cerebriforme]
MYPLPLSLLLLEKFASTIFCWVIKSPELELEITVFHIYRFLFVMNSPASETLSYIR